MVTDALHATAEVVIVKVAVVAPPATATLAGACAVMILLLDSVTTTALDGAGPVKVAVPMDEGSSEHWWDSV